MKGDMLYSTYKKIVGVLRDGSRLNASKIARKIGREYNSVKPNLQLLEEEGLLISEREGRCVYYRMI